MTTPPRPSPTTATAGIGSQVDDLGTPAAHLRERVPRARIGPLAACPALQRHDPRVATAPPVVDQCGELTHPPSHPNRSLWSCPSRSRPFPGRRRRLCGHRAPPHKPELLPARRLVPQVAQLSIACATGTLPQKKHHMPGPRQAPHSRRMNTTNPPFPRGFMRFGVRDEQSAKTKARPGQTEIASR